MTLFLSILVGCTSTNMDGNSEITNANSQLRCEELRFSEPVSGFSCIRWVNDSIYFKAQGTDGKTYVFSSTESGEITNKIPLDFLAAKDLTGTTFAYGENSLWLVAQQSIKNEEQEEIKIDSYLFQVDYSGSVIQELSLDEIYPDVGAFETISSIAMVEDGLLAIVDMKLLHISSEAGVVVQQVQANSFLSNFVTDANLKLYCRDVSGQLMPVTLEPLSFGEPVYKGSNLSIGNGEYDILMSADDGLYGVAFDTSVQECLLKWSDCYITEGTASAIHLSQNGDVLFYYFDSISRGLKICSLTADDAPPARTALRLSIDTENNLDIRVYEAINTFNRTNREYVIEIEAYPSDTEINKLAVTGDAPDLFYLGNSSEQSLVDQGLLADLYPLMDADPSFDRENILNAYRKAHEINGSLYSLNPFFSIITLAGKSEFVGERSGWSVEDFVEAAESAPDGITIFNGFNNESALLEILSASVNSFVDLENHTCDFESDEFISLLKIIHSKQTYESSEYDESGILGNHCLLDFVGYTGSHITSSESSQEHEITPVGYPGVSGSGAAMSYADGSFWGIYEGSTQKDAAWSFLKTLLTEEYESEYIRGFPITVDSFELCVQHIRDKDILDKEELDDLISIIEHTTTTRNYNSPIIKIIMEEVPYYFSGEKSAEDVAAIIQNRVQTYIAEQG